VVSQARTDQGGRTQWSVLEALEGRCEVGLKGHQVHHGWASGPFGLWPL
jgi:hypothetical protein